MTRLTIAINIKMVQGAAGGGFQFADALSAGLAARGHRVVRGLEPGVDVILMVSFRHNSSSAAFTPDQAADYLYEHPRVAAVLRVNDSDEARFSAHLGIAKAVQRAQAACDHTVFVSNYLRDLFLERYLDPSIPQSVIRNAADPNLFCKDGFAPRPPSERLKLVTHHWSPAYTKGFDVYERVDRLLDEPEWRACLELSVVGALPLGVTLPNCRHVPMLSGQEIALELKRHHAYVTGARGEAAPMHAIEAIQCGLPILYLEAGSLPEYCAGHGIGFNLGNFESRLRKMAYDYDAILACISEPAFSLSRMVDDYESLFLRLVASKAANPLPGPSWRARWGRRTARQLKRAAKLARRLLR